MFCNRYRVLGIVAIALFASFGAQAAFPDDISTVQYWGQNSAGSQKNLATYCDDSTDALIMSFIIDFNIAGLPTLNLANACEGSTFSGSTLLECPKIGTDIKACQAKGKKILLSLGGASGAYGLSSEADGKKFAQTLWNLFGKGSSKTRPFGDAVIDGFDLDIEGGPTVGYSALVKELRTLFKKDTSKSYYITAAPQCPFPDALLGKTLDSSDFDAVNVQFYNNFCSVSDDSSFNFKTWDDWATTKSPNKKVKIFLTIPGAEKAASKGYASFSDIQKVIKSVSSMKSFGGVTMWDASQAYANTDGSPNFAVAVSKFLKKGSGGGSSGGSGSGNSSEKPTHTSGTPKPTSSKKHADPTKTSSKKHAKPTQTSSKKDADPTQTSTKEHATQTNEAQPTGNPSPGKCVSVGEKCDTPAPPICSGNNIVQCGSATWAVIQTCPSGETCVMDGDIPSCKKGKSTQSCPNKSKRSLWTEMFMSPPKPKKVRRSIATQVSVSKVDGRNIDFLIHARKLNSRPFKRNIVIQFKTPPNIRVTGADNGRLLQTARHVRLHVRNPNTKSMSLVLRVKGELDNGILQLPHSDDIIYTL